MSGSLIEPSLLSCFAVTKCSVGMYLGLFLCQTRIFTFQVPSFLSSDLRTTAETVAIVSKTNKTDKKILKYSLRFFVVFSKKGCLTRVCRRSKEQTSELQSLI